MTAAPGWVTKRRRGGDYEVARSMDSLLFGFVGYTAIAVLSLYVAAWIYGRMKTPRYIAVGVTVVLLVIAFFMGVLANG